MRAISNGIRIQINWKEPRRKLCYGNGSAAPLRSLPLHCPALPSCAQVPCWARLRGYRGPTVKSSPSSQQGRPSPTPTPSPTPGVGAHRPGRIKAGSGAVTAAAAAAAAADDDDDADAAVAAGAARRPGYPSMKRSSEPSEPSQSRRTVRRRRSRGFGAELCQKFKRKFHAADGRPHDT